MRAHKKRIGIFRGGGFGLHCLLVLLFVVLFSRLPIQSAFPIPISQAPNSDILAALNMDSAEVVKLMGGSMGKSGKIRRVD